MSEGKIRVGIGGWNFEPWRDNFYPKGWPQARELEYASRRLTVAVTANREEYRPATNAQVRVKVTDPQSKPVQSEVTLWAVDYGVLSLTAYRTPELRALASRYGNPDDVLSKDWVPYLPGINTPGKYEEYAKNPWKTFSELMKKVETGTYEYFYPATKTKK